MLRKTGVSIWFVAIILLGFAGRAAACECIAVNTGVDFYNRYVWRGLDIASTPSIQPALSLAYSGFELGAWGAYTVSGGASESDEIDFWLSYSLAAENGMSVTLLATDYYFPNAGVKLFNFNDHDAVDDNDVPDPGAHLLEIGLLIGGSESFPLTLSAFANVYNDAGNNMYFQLDYPVEVGDVDLGIFCGFAGGSEDNPDYYGTENFNAINVGVSADREIDVTESFSLPMSVSLIVNPNAEISYIVAGLSF